MNRNHLLIAIAAVAVVGIAAGVLILGSQQPQAPLSGSMGSASTILTLDPTTCSVPDSNGSVTITVSGELHTTFGNPVAGRTVEVHRLKCGSTGCNWTGPDGEGSVVTGPEGRFSLVKSEAPTLYNDGSSHIVDYATFAGDAMYAGSQSSFQTRFC
jgi:hypothetical protein